MRLLRLLLAVLAATGCTNAYWDRPGARLPDLAAESKACYQTAVDAPAARAVAPGEPRLLARTEPPPRLWERPPQQAALEHFDEQLRYERCMRARGWRAVKAVPPAR
jgi:hypothetical protein